MTTMVEKIVTLARSHGITQEQLEQMAGLSKGRISKWKDEVGEPTCSQGLRLSQILKVPLEYLVNDSLAQLPPPVVSEDDRAILDLVHDLGLSRREALKRIAIVPPSSQVTGRSTHAGVIVRDDAEKESGTPKAGHRQRSKTG